MKQSIQDIDVDNKKVLVRSDLNVPMEGSEIVDDARIRASLPTIRYLLEHNAAVAICAHFGRPKGKVQEKYSLKPVATRLATLLGKDVPLCPDCLGTEMEQAVEALSPGQVILLENTRFHPEEEGNDPDFAAQLAKPFDWYVNDAFGTAHRAHASTEGVAHHLPAVAGLLMLAEIEVIRGLRVNPQHPFVLMLGGAKTSSKLPVLNRLLDSADRILIGGGTCNNFLLAQGLSIGQSEFEESCIDEAGEMLARANNKIVLPVDAVIAPELSADAETRIVPIDAIPDDWRKVDIGPETVALFASEMKDAKTVAWNGPLGFTEIEPFAKGSRDIGRIMATLDATTVIGGGDTAAALMDGGLLDAMSHVSTGGGAFFKLLETDDLPALNVLRDNE